MTWCFPWLSCWKVIQLHIHNWLMIYNLVILPFSSISDLQHSLIWLYRLSSLQSHQDVSHSVYGDAHSTLISCLYLLCCDPSKLPQLEYQLSTNNLRHRGNSQSSLWWKHDPNLFPQLLNIHISHHLYRFSHMKESVNYLSLSNGVNRLPHHLCTSLHLSPHVILPLTP